MVKWLILNDIDCVLSHHNWLLVHLLALLCWLIFSHHVLACVYESICLWIYCFWNVLTELTMKLYIFFTYFCKKKLELLFCTILLLAVLWTIYYKALNIDFLYILSLSLNSHLPMYRWQTTYYDEVITMTGLTYDSL